MCHGHGGLKGACKDVLDGSAVPLRLWPQVCGMLVSNEADNKAKEAYHMAKET